jgi:hypothetical protein
MPTFAESIAEEFHSEVDLNWSVSSTTQAVASFEVRTIAVEVDFEQREPGGPWHVAFNSEPTDLPDRSVVTSAFRIFNGVFQAVREFTETREPEVLVFIAKDEDLASIYQTYLRREAADLEALGYRLEGPHKVEPYTEWTLRRIRPSAWRE